MKEIEKPTIMKAKELETSIIDLINTTNIPIFVVRPIIEKIFNQLVSLEQDELTRETNEYNKQVEESKKTKNKS